MKNPEMPFEFWKRCLRQDCERRDKVLAFLNLGEECLRVLWEVGTGPSVQAIVDGGAKAT